LTTGVKDFRSANEAIAHATEVATALARDRAERAGSAAPGIDVAVDDRRIRDAGGSEIFIEAIVTATAGSTG
jgi:hypothetical protein